MTYILHTIQNVFFYENILSEKFFLLEYVPESLFGNKSTLVQ